MFPDLSTLGLTSTSFGGSGISSSSSSSSGTSIPEKALLPAAFCFFY
jgi:hypothetical protein